ncbi:MAG: BREX-2 system phosphatase PglZ [Deltaproteobacteria bacterium]|nr:BREX-2 system phosphatase PglZ [Deltaproteobacteria bacterium]
MTSHVPALTRVDIRSKLDELLTAGRRHYLFALHGTGEEDVVHRDGSPADVAVIPVRSELELRRRLLEIDDDACAAFLVPWEGTLPMDLQGRFANEGRVFRVGRETRILGLFGAVEFEPEVRTSPLISYLLEHEAGQRFQGGGKLTVNRLWQAWLERTWGLVVEGELALDVLLGWAAVSGRGPEFVRTLDERGASAVREGLYAHLASRLGPAGPLVWKAWERGDGAAALQMAVLAAAVATAPGDPAVATWWQLTVQQVFGDARAIEATARLAEASEPALRTLERRLDSAAVRKLVAAADARIQLDAVRVGLSASSRLPSAWQARLSALGTALAACAAAPSRATATEAVTRWRGLAGHVLHNDGDQLVTMERAEMAVRLASWLVLRTDQDQPRSQTPYTEVECLATWYATEGGHVDWARRWARGGGDGGVFAGIEAVLAAADRAREDLDHRFAAALPAYHEATRPPGQVLPIDHAVERIAGRFLREQPDRRVLVVLMDGMAWAQAVEILTALGTETTAWGPLAWHALSKNRIGDGPYPAVLTNFPTVTEISRSAFFAGKPVSVGKDHKSADDPERWKANKVALEFCDPQAPPLLLLRGEGHTRDGSASAEALSQVEDRRRRIVAVVVNAIDSSLKGDSAHRTKWTANTIKSLRDLLDKAREVGRTVLLCADHGHVPADRLAPAGHAKTKGARWRTWEKREDPIAEFEVGLPASADGVWAPAGAHGVVLLTDDARKYGGGTSAGEHGGASLAEAVAPCVLIGPEDHRDLREDPALGVRPAIAPTWWNFDLGGEIAPVVAAAEPKPKRTKPPVQAQLQLPQLAKPEPVVPVSEAVVTPFARSAVLEARVVSKERRATVIAAVEFLLARNGIADGAAFASAMKTFPARVGGLVSVISEALNVDGYEVLSYDRQSKQVRLDKGKLAEQFEVEL